MKVLEISPYEPPVSGWTMRIKLLRRVIQERGGRCEILDVGPSRQMERPDCVTVLNGWDYLVKVVRFSRSGFTIHGHINAEYFRGLLLTLAAFLIARVCRNRCVLTFHAGIDQPFLSGWRRIALWPFFWTAFSLADAVICNSEAVKQVVHRYRKERLVVPVQAFSRQYLEYQTVPFEAALSEFIQGHEPLVTTYVCFRDGFYLEVLLGAMARLVRTRPNIGLVMVGTGERADEIKQEIARLHLTSHIFLAGDAAHDAFMTLLAASAVHLRTPTTDGVSATVLEALALRIPVVASDNGTRPEQAITYDANDAGDLAEKINWTLEHRAEVAASLATFSIKDTAKAEVDVIFGIASLAVKEIVQAASRETCS